MPQRITEKILNKPAGQTGMKEKETETAAASPLPSRPYGTQDQNGIIIVQDNRFYITSPLPGGEPAFLSAVPPVMLELNNQPVAGPVPVVSTDRVTWSIQEPPPYQITVSEDKLQAFFTLNRVEQYEWNLVNTPASSHLAVRAERDPSTLLSTLGIEQIIADFEKKSISQNLNIPAIYAELNHPTHLPVCVAEGTPPAAGEDAKLDLFFAGQADSTFEETEGVVDYRSYLRIPTAKKGDIIARKHPPREGVPGYDVYGSILHAPAPRDIKVMAKEGTLLRPSHEITALVEGRPRVTGTYVKTFDITTAYTVPGSVNRQIGNIVFSGDVIVHQDVEDNSIIESLGNVYVCGNVHNSTITATGSIYILGKVGNSQLYSGAFGVTYNRLYHLSEKLIEEVSLLRQASRLLIQEIQSRQQTVKFGQVIQLLMESKYKRIPVLIRDLESVVASIKYISHPDNKQLQRILDVFLRPALFIDAFNDAMLVSLLKLLKELYTGVARMEETNVCVDIPECHNTIIKSSGDICIHKDGTLQSDLLSLADITFLMPDAVCGESQLEAGGTLTAQTVGSEAGPGSTLTAGRKIIVGKMYGGSVTVGRHSQEITEPAEDMIFTLQNPGTD
ncbi:FapA family protein [Paenibacillus graminis]|uniref:FapA family protein n=1 Tax=Paenibacillus graminis TaxID=189425 RepID=UPI000470251C|nr:FapA family protein [Paenibacillus graminis]